MSNDVEQCSLLVWANSFNISPTFDSSKIHKRPGIQAQAAAAVVTMDTNMDTSLRDRLVPTRIPINVERERERGGGGGGGKRFQLHSTFMVTKEMWNGC